MEGEDGYVIGGLGITGASFEGRVTRAVNEGIELLGWRAKMGIRRTGDNWGVLRRKGDAGGE